MIEVEATREQVLMRSRVFKGDILLTPAAALELAARAAGGGDQHPERLPCPVTAHDGTRCLGDVGHEGKHWTAAGWFGQEGDAERAR